MTATKYFADDFQVHLAGRCPPGTSLPGTSLPGTSLPGTSLPVRAHRFVTKHVL